MENIMEKVLLLEKEMRKLSKAADDEKLRKKAEIDAHAEAAKHELYEKMNKKIAEIKETEEKLLRRSVAEIEENTEASKNRLNALYEQHHKDWENDLLSALFE